MTGRKTTALGWRALWFGAITLSLLLAAAPGRASNGARERLDEGARLFQDERYEQAVREWRRGLDEARKSGDRVLAGAFLDSLAMAAVAEGDHEEAVKHYEEAVKISREDSSLDDLGRRLQAFASMRLLMGQPEAALPLAAEVAGLARGLGDRRIETLALGTLGEAELELGNPVQALEDFEEALDLAGEGEDRVLEARLLAKAGLAYQAMGHYSLALNHLRRSQTAIEEWTSELDGEALALHLDNLDRLGRLFWEAGKPVEAIEMHRSAFRLAVVKDLDERAAWSTRLRYGIVATLDSSPRGLRRARREGLERMLARLREHGLDEIAKSVEEQLEEFADDAAEPPAVFEMRGPFDVRERLTGYAAGLIVYIERVLRAEAFSPEEPGITYLAEGTHARSGEGRTEIGLGPAARLFLDEEAAIVWLSAYAPDVYLDLTAGSAYFLIDRESEPVAAECGGERIVFEPNSQVRLDFDEAGCRVRVIRGSLTSAQGVELKRRDELRLDGVQAKAERGDRPPADDFEQWARRHRRGLGSLDWPQRSQESSRITRSVCTPEDLPALPACRPRE